MGWQHYSRRLWLSRGNHYILYLKAMTVQMRLVGSVFHSGHEAVFHRSADGSLSRVSSLCSVPGRGVRGYVSC
jgi:hypothetical protein